MTKPQPLTNAFETTLPAIFIAIAVGNTRTRVGVLKKKECLKAQSIASDSPEDIARFAADLVDEFELPSAEPVIIMSSVADQAAQAIEDQLRERFNWATYRIGRDLQIPIRHTLSEAGEQSVGQDRLLCALGAYGVVKQACIVVDMGTAITVDFVDGTGVFHGGAILPGVNMMLQSLTNSTAHLPEIKFVMPDQSSKEPAKETEIAMRLGVMASARGAIRFLAEQYAEFYEGYPQIIATGGDIGVLEDDDLIEAFVPDLQLQGIWIACQKTLGDDDEDEDQTEFGTNG
ncbi:MAG: type III pantothenate kinase [Phycisphaerales bacterium]